MIQSRIAKLCLYILISMGLGFASALFTNEFVSRPVRDYSSCVEIQEQDPAHDCSGAAIKSKGWPFPAKYILANGSESKIEADISGYCIGGCDIETIGGQLGFNAAILSTAYFVMSILFMKITHRFKAKKF